MGVVIPWVPLLALIEPDYPKAGRGWQPMGLEKMLRIYFLSRFTGLVFMTRSTIGLDPWNPSSKGPRARGLLGGVSAEGPGFDARREMATEDGVVIIDPLQRRLDRFRHGGSGPLTG
jgi:hypothetical protein